MKATFVKLLGLALVIAVIASVQAAEDKEETKKGTLVCGKCTLKETKACSNCLKVKEGDKEVIYTLDDKGNKETYHKKCCAPNSSVEASVTGVFNAEKKTVKPSKVEVKE